MESLSHKTHRGPRVPVGTNAHFLQGWASQKPWPRKSHCWQPRSQHATSFKYGDKIRASSSFSFLNNKSSSESQQACTLRKVKESSSVERQTQEDSGAIQNSEKPQNGGKEIKTIFSYFNLENLSMEHRPHLRPEETLRASKRLFCPKWRLSKSRHSPTQCIMRPLNC